MKKLFLIILFLLTSTSFAADYTKVISDIEDKWTAENYQHNIIEYGRQTLPFWQEQVKNGELKTSDYVFLVKGYFSMLEIYTDKKSKPTYLFELKGKVIQLPDRDVEELYYWIEDIYFMKDKKER
jgi:hypothetical protein